MAKARAQPLKDLYLLVAYAGLEAEALKPSASSPSQPPSSGGPRRTSSTVEYRLGKK